MKVTAPNKEYSGRVGRDIFVDGECADGSPEQEAYYRRRGYTLDGASATPVGQPPAGNASRAEWVEFLAGQGIDAPGDAKRDELRDLWEEHHAEVAD